MLTWDDLEQASDKAYRNLVKKVIFRASDAVKLLGQLWNANLGKEHIYQEGLDNLIEETYRDAVKEHDLTPITQPEVDAPIFEMGQPYHFSINIPIITPVELADYQTFHFEREEATVTSEEVEQGARSLTDPR